MLVTKRGGGTPLGGVATATLSSRCHTTVFGSTALMLCVMNTRPSEVEAQAVAASPGLRSMAETVPPAQRLPVAAPSVGRRGGELGAARLEEVLRAAVVDRAPDVVQARVLEP